MATSKERLAHAADIAGEMHDDDTNYCLAESIRRLLEATPGAAFKLPHAEGTRPAGEELYALATGRWSRRPPGTTATYAAPDGGRFFVKVGHLAGVR